MEAVKMKEVTQKTLLTIINDPLTLKLSRVMLHQSVDIPHGATETTISDSRTRGIKIYFHPMYGAICENKGRYILIPSANVIVGYE